MEAIKEAAAEFRLDGALESDTYASIVSDNHFKRLRDLMQRSSGRVVVGGDTKEEGRRITPTVYSDVKEGDALLERFVRPLTSLIPFSSFADLWVLKISEIFGPILPIVPMDDIRQAIEYINAQ